MKHTGKKIAAMIAAVAIAAVSVTVQTDAESADTAAGAAQVTESAGNAVQTEDLYNGLDPEAVVLTVGEEEVPLKKAYFLMKFQQAIVQDMQKSVYGSQWYSLPIYEGDRSFQDNMKDSIMNLLTRMSLARQYQKESGVTISKKEQENIQKAVNAFLASNSEEALAAMMADEALVTEILEDYTILSKVITAVTKDVQAEYGEARTYSYVYGSFGDDAGVKDLNDVSEETETLLEAFNNIYKSVSGGADFDTAAAEQGYPTAIHTYFAGDDEDTLAELNAIMDGKAAGEVSEVVYVGDNAGAFIGCMQEVDADSLEDAKASYLLSEKLKEWKATMGQWLSEKKVDINETLWSQVTMEKSITTYKVQSNTDTE